MACLQAVDLAKSYRQRKVVDGISLSVETGQVVGMLGPNGAGKTTSFYAIAGFIRLDQGKILLDGVDITAMPIHKRAQQGIAYLAQEPSVFKKLTVEENVRIILEPLGLSRQEIDNRIGQLLVDFKIEHLARSKGYSLSGGERRRVEIMRTLATEPLFVLLDEPFAGIDPISVAALQGIIRDLRKKGLGILISDHNVRETLSVCDYAFIVSSGKILSEGCADRIIADNNVRQLYLGEDFRM